MNKPIGNKLIETLEHDLYANGCDCEDGSESHNSVVCDIHFNLFKLEQQIAKMQEALFLIACGCCFNESDIEIDYKFYDKEIK